MISASSRAWHLAASAAASLGVTLLCAATAQAQIVYSNDFETNTAGFSTTGVTTLPTTGAGFGTSPNSTFLGRLSSESTTLSLTGLTTGQSYTVAFDLFIGDSWDGDSGGGVGPDSWRLRANGTTLVDATFSNLSNQTQTYSDATPIGAGANPFQTGADVSYSQSTGFFGNYGIYRFSTGAGNPTLSFVATSSTASLVFEGVNLQGVGDEYWAIDNVVVTQVNAGAAAPEPGSAGLLLTGVLTVAGFVVRRTKARG